MSAIKRIGFACKWIDRPDQVDGLKPKDSARKYNTGTTTVAWLSRQTKNTAEQKLWDLMKSNIEATQQLVSKVGDQNEHLRMVRLSSDILPVYTEPTWSYFWRQADVVQYLERYFAKIGEIAREKNVRLSFHPGQYCVLASDRDDVAQKSIEEFEYHADMIRWMGYGQKFQDFKCNVHIAGRGGVPALREVYQRLSPEARNTITIENEEISYGLDDCLFISDLIPVVLDIHHHWIREGEYIQQSDDRIKKIIDSWRGVRPVIHYSVSREDVLVGHDSKILPDRKLLLESGHNKQKLRAHSNFYWNDNVNRWAITHWDWADFMCESKAKNLASFEFYNKYAVCSTN